MDQEPIKSPVDSVEDSIRTRAQQELEKLQSSYRSALACFGPQYVARINFQTREVYEGDLSGRRPTGRLKEIKVTQDLEKRATSFYDVFCSYEKNLPGNSGVPSFIHQIDDQRYQKIKRKAFEDLDPDDEDEHHLKKQIEKYQLQLRSFYNACVEAAFLGYMPFSDDRSLFQSNRVGIVTNPESGQINVKLLKFDAPLLDILPNDARVTLREIIESHKANGELPIEKVTESEEEVDYTSGFARIDRKDKPGSHKRFAPWYTDALYKLTTPKLAGDLESFAHIFTDTIDHLDIQRAEIWSESYEWESFRRLTGAPEYLTHVTAVQRRVLLHRFIDPETGEEETYAYTDNITERSSKKRTLSAPDEHFYLLRSVLNLSRLRTEAAEKILRAHRKAADQVRGRLSADNFERFIASVEETIKQLESKVSQEREIDLALKSAVKRDYDQYTYDFDALDDATKRMIIEVKGYTGDLTQQEREYASQKGIPMEM